MDDYWFLIPLALVAVLFGMLAAINSWLLLVVLACVLSAWLLLKKPGYALLSIILVRPVSEAFRETPLLQVGPLGFNSNWLLGILVILLALFHVVKKKVNLFKYSVSLPYLLFLTLCVVSMVQSDYLLSGVVDLMRLFTIYLILILVAEFFPGGNRGENVVNVILLSSVPSLLMGAYQLIAYRSLSYSVRLAGFASTPVAYANFLLLITVLSVVMFFHKNLPKHKILYGILAASSFISLAYTVTRTAYVGLVLALLIIGILMYRRLLLVLFVVVLLLASIPLFSSRFAILYSKEISDMSLESRLILWSRMKDFILSKPLLGNGLGSFESSSEKIAGFNMPPHSGYLKFLAEVGVVGLLFYLWALLVLLKRCYLVYVKTNNVFYKNISLACLALLCSNLVTNLVHNSFSLPTYQFHLWALLGVIYSLDSGKFRPTSPRRS